MRQISVKEEKEYKEELEKYLLGHYDVKLKSATTDQIFRALAGVVNNKLYTLRERQNAEPETRSAKQLHYVSIEFLLGKSLKNHLWNLGIEPVITKILKSAGVDIEDVYAKEDESCLGNGGLGRLAACFLDSLSAEGYPVCGHCIKYDYGLFKQKIIDGKQFELPDSWPVNSEVWLNPRGDESCTVYFGGKVVQSLNKDGTLAFKYENAMEVVAYPYDMLISGYDGKKINVLKLWSAQSKDSFDTRKFSQGEYAQAMAVKDEIESISKVLYPSDEHEQGKSLRLKQEYFLASAVSQNIISTHLKQNRPLAKLPDYACVHINDTHPVLIIPELMRLLMDEQHLGWNEAWAIVSKMIGYTNHTLLSEALTIKEINLLDRYIPRIAMIIREMDRRFKLDLAEKGVDKVTAESMAILSNGRVNMTNLAVYASHTVNGVSAVHSLILKNSLLRGFAEVYPNKIINITNGVTQRLWMAESNPAQDALLTVLIGNGYHKNADELKKLDKFATDDKAISEMEKIKLMNKINFSKYLLKTQGVLTNPNTRFDVQVKRIHEYKRQLLNALKIIYLYGQLKENPNKDVTPQTFIFGGKAASGYYMAKRIIKLIYNLSQDIDQHKNISKKLKVVFVENYGVSVAQLLMPATDVTEQISLAGREASGTGNMKAVMNGALMLHTRDGANIEIVEKCGDKNSFAFGLTTDEVAKVWSEGYNPHYYYNNSDAIKKVISMLNEGFMGESFKDISDYLLGESQYKDIYMCLADFDSYLAAHNAMDKVYRNKKNWYSKVIHNISCMGYFSSDRAINDYVSKVWKLKKV